MNKKGFTLTELLVVIAILGIIAIITVPTIGNVIKDSRENAYNEQERSIVNAARTYMANHSTELPAQRTDASKCIPIEDIKKDGLLSASKTKIKNTDGTKEEATGIVNPMYKRTSTNIEVKEKDQYFDGSVKVSWDGTKYTYTYQDNNCEASGNSSSTISSLGNYTIENRYTGGVMCAQAIEEICHDNNYVYYFASGCNDIWIVYENGTKYPFSTVISNKMIPINELFNHENSPIGRDTYNANYYSDLEVCP